jgi:hypothetical protein
MKIDRFITEPCIVVLQTDLPARARAGISLLLSNLSR